MIRIGKIAATHGLQGHVLLTHTAVGKDWLHEGEAVFVALKRDSHIPFYVQSFKRVSQDAFHVLFEDVRSLEDAKKIVGKDVFVPQDILGAAVGDNPLTWIGFSVTDAQKGSLGPLKDVVQSTGGWIGTVVFNGKEALIPLVKPLLVEVNVRNRYIRTDLPEGLLEI